MSNATNQALFAYFPPEIDPRQVQDVLQMQSGLHKYDGQSVLLIYAGRLELLTRDQPNQGFWRVPMVPHHTPRLEDWKTFTRMVVQTLQGEKAVLARKEDTHRLGSMIAACTQNAPTAPRRARTPTDKQPQHQQAQQQQQQQQWKQPAWARKGSTGRFKAAAKPADAPATTAPRLAPGAASLEPTPPPAAPTAPPGQPWNPGMDVAGAPKPPRRRMENKTFWPSPGESLLPGAPEGEARNRLVLVAKVPAKKLKLMSEAGWLEQLCKPYGRGAKVAGKYWVCAIKATSVAAAEQTCVMLRDAIDERFPGESAATWAAYDEPGNVSGGAPPPVVQGLIHYIQRG